MKEWLKDLPSTNLRIVITLLIVIGTALVHLTTGRATDTNWLMFLAAMAGIDALQHIGKRATEKPEMTVTTTEPGPPAKVTTTTVNAPHAEDAPLAPTVVTIRPHDPPEGAHPEFSERTRPKTSAEAEEG